VSVLVSTTGVSVCSHCGQNPDKTPWRKLSLLASDNFGIILWIVWLVIWSRSGANDWQQDAVFLLLAAGAGATVLYFRQSGSGGKGSVPSLGLNQHQVPTEASWTRPQPPAVPEKWSNLMYAPRPREVFWPFWSQVWAVMEVAFIVGSVGVLIFLVRGQHASFSDWGRAWPKNLTFFAVTAISDAFVIVGLYREIGNRLLLRDGEATIGAIVDWIDRKRATPVAIYQFWTRSGERFEHRGQVTSDKSEYSAPGVVPVFYFPEDPSRSLALCSTTLRVRIPNADLAARAERLGFKS
jgi:hypothetical protein